MLLPLGSTSLLWKNHIVKRLEATMVFSNDRYKVCTSKLMSEFLIFCAQFIEAFPRCQNFGQENEDISDEK